MDFARKQLEKYGWKEGDSLGKDGNQGIKEALKPNYKSGNAGVGFDHSKELVDTWWSRAYDDSLNRITVKFDEAEGEVNVLTENEGSDEMSTMRKRMHKANIVQFSKTALLEKGEEKTTVPEGTVSEIKNAKAKSKSRILNFNDPEIIKVCEGRTAHKAARFGLKLSGKLARIAAQEESLMNEMNKKQNYLDKSEISKPKKKRIKKDVI